MYKISEKLLTPSKFTRPQLPIKQIKGIVIHYVGSPKSSALANRNYWESLKDGKFVGDTKKYKFASAHEIIDQDGSVLITVPSTEVAYHGGAVKADSPIAKKLNTQKLSLYLYGIECTHITDDGQMSVATYNTLVERCVDLCIKYKLNALEDLWLHFDVSGKECHRWFCRYPKEWILFKQKVANTIIEKFNPPKKEEKHMQLKLGSKGDEVKLLQTRLHDLGFNIIVDSDFGNKTLIVVKEFQNLFGLTDDGIVGDFTWKLILKTTKEEVDLKKKTIPKPVEKPYEVIKYNNYTTIVKMKKDKLKIDVILCKQPKETLGSVYKRLNPKCSFLINGGLFAMNNGNSMSTLIDESQEIIHGYFSEYGLYVKTDGTIGFDNYKNVKDIKDFMGASPTLIIDGKINIDLKGLTKDKNFTDNRHPRTCIGMDDVYFYIVIVDGRKIGKLGMTINELAKLGMDLKLKYFINLDGGGSCRLLGSDGKAINSPTEDRPVDNCIAFYV